MRASANSKKTCSKCDKGTGAFSCDGCQQSFCLKHVAEHREELIHQMDDIEQGHDIFHEDLLNQIKKQNEHTLFDRINQWERESIQKIEQSAEQSRIELNQILDKIIDHGKKSLNKISSKLRRARELDDFFENDLIRWTQQLTQLREEIKCMSNSIDIISDNSTSIIKFIKIVQKEPVDNPETNWISNFSWFSDVKALFYDRANKSLSTGGSGTKKCSTQTYTKGSIAIIKVNNTDYYIDIENDGWTEQDQNMTGWVLRRDVDKKPKIIYKFPENFILKCRSNVRIMSGKKNNIEEKDILIDTDQESWDIGTNIITCLIDDHGEEKASVIQTLVK